MTHRIPLTEMIPDGPMREIGWDGMDEDDRATFELLINENEREFYGRGVPSSRMGRRRRRRRRLGGWATQRQPPSES